MRNDYTHISVILDRTGSMETIRDDTIGGFNAFLNEQKSAAGYATMTLVQFDSQDPYEVLHKFAPVTAVTEPVSYTHLDVYKRQAWRCSTTASTAIKSKVTPST